MTASWRATRSIVTARWLGLPHVLIEIRQDLIADAAAARALAARLVPVLERALAAMEPATHRIHPARWCR